MSRQAALFLALGALAVASLLASIGAWVLLWRDRRTRRATEAADPDPEAERTGDSP